jgi:hypothetical protein
MENEPARDTPSRQGDAASLKNDMNFERGMNAPYYGPRTLNRQQLKPLE